ncbi:hypothetical protein LTR37_018259 [Vermiconidia calcicola]|uniref:Uncharacterized protein n=1 Tax=Vermiconidia calcicola TaxID=1690605 RepID=A0ACC3MHN7_9PEZI|nr:hypothetical protein LTR37_018259 [Vermiconidia calcicola]
MPGIEKRRGFDYPHEGGDAPPWQVAARKQQEKLTNTLTVIFVNFRFLGNVVKVEVKDQDDDEPVAHDLKTLEMLCGVHSRPCDDPSRLVRAAIHALALSALPVSNLSIATFGCHWYFYDLVADPKILSSTRSVFKSAEQLKIQYDYEYSLEDDEIVDFYDLLQSAPKLRRLSLIGTNWPYHPIWADQRIISEYFLAGQYRALETWELTGLALEFTRVAALIKRTPKLKSIRFHECLFHTLSTVENELVDQYMLNPDITQAEVVAKIVKQLSGMAEVLPESCRISIRSEEEEATTP